VGIEQRKKRAGIEQVKKIGEDRVEKMLEEVVW
jgi:hypothetical protein